MKNIIRRINVIAIVLITMLALSTNVKAANDSYKVSLNANHSQVHNGDELTLTIALSDISVESGEKGIGAYKSNVEFDSSIFEYDSAEGTEKWDEPFYQNKTIIGTTKDCKVVNTAQDIGKIKLKVKENAALGETTIKLTNFSGSNAVSDIATSDASVKVTIQKKVGSDDDENSGNQDENDGNGGSENNGNQDDENQNGESQNDGNQNGENQDGGSQNGEGENGEGQNGGSQNDGSQNSGNNGSSNNENQNGSSTNINDAKKDDVRPGILPQTGDIDILTFILISLFALVSITLLVRIKLLNKKETVKRD